MVEQPATQSVIIKEVIVMKVSFTEKLGEHVYQLRTTYSLSQRKLAKAADINRNAIRDLELHRSIPSVTVLAKLAEYFNVPIDILLGIHPENWVNIGHLTGEQKDAVRRLIDSMGKGNR